MAESVAIALQNELIDDYDEFVSGEKLFHLLFFEFIKKAHINIDY